MATVTMVKPGPSGTSLIVMLIDAGALVRGGGPTVEIVAVFHRDGGVGVQLAASLRR